MRGFSNYTIKRQNKYNSVKQTYNGYNYMSKKEAQKAFELDLLIKAGEVERWERQKQIRLDVNGEHICNYYIDFVIYWKDGTTEFCEVKGFETDVFRLKWKLFTALYKDKGYKLTIEK